MVGTGDLSELALGWCTYNADHMSMYGVNASIPKTLIRWMIDALVEFEIFPDSTAVLRDILDTPISPELLPPDENGKIAQQTEKHRRPLRPPRLLPLLRPAVRLHPREDFPPGKSGVLPGILTGKPSKNG